jgi:hypothetical protein
MWVMKSAYELANYQKLRHAGRVMATSKAELKAPTAVGSSGELLDRVIE